LDRIKKIEEIRDNYFKQNFQKIDDIINNVSLCDSEVLSEFVIWLEEYERKHSHLILSENKEVQQQYLKNKKENNKRLKSLRIILKNITRK
jgi:dsDNA-binding SOS-regulon protein